MNKLETFESYLAMVVRMSENHGVLDARNVALGADWIRVAYEWGMTPQRAASKLTNSVLGCAR